jgi:hypothetical protein
MKKSIIKILLPIILLFSSCNNSSNYSEEKTLNYEENKISFEDQEKSDPLKFLTFEGSYRESLFGRQIVIKGTITNSATIAIFKDIVLDITFYSKTNTVISTETNTVYDYFEPNSTKNFKLKLKAPKGTSSVDWKIISALSE